MKKNSKKNKVNRTVFHVFFLLNLLFCNHLFSQATEPDRIAGLSNPDVLVSVYDMPANNFYTHNTVIQNPNRGKVYVFRSGQSPSFCINEKGFIVKGNNFGVYSPTGYFMTTCFTPNQLFEIKTNSRI